MFRARPQHAREKGCNVNILVLKCLFPTHKKVLVCLVFLKKTHTHGDLEHGGFFIHPLKRCTPLADSAHLAVHL